MKDLLIRFGGSVKALGDGKVGGYLVQFSSENDPDLTGDFFTPASDFDIDWGDGGVASIKSTVYYNHALDQTVKNLKLGKAEMKLDDVGVWVEAQMMLSDEYQKAIYKLAEEGRLGWSSGTAPHLVERKAVGNAFEITAWPLGLDASLTPTPAEPRNSAMPLKSWEAISPTFGADGKLEVKADIMGQDIEQSLTIAACSTLVDRLFYSVIYSQIRGEYDYDASLDDYVRIVPALPDALDTIGKAFDECKELALRVVEAIMSGAEGAESGTDAQKSIKSLFNDPDAKAVPAAVRFDTQLDSALAAVESCITRGEGIAAKRAADGRTISKDRIARFAELKARIDALVPSTTPNTPAMVDAQRAQTDARMADLKLASFKSYLPAA